MNTLERWHRMLKDKDPEQLSDLIADDAVFHSPVVFTPQIGKPLTIMYLSAASQILGNDSFVYTREIVDQDQAALEFSVTIDGIVVNGVDLIQWNKDGLITDFKVLLRPLQGIKLIHQKMASLLTKDRGS